MSGITVLVWLLYAASCVQFGTGLLMDDTVESSMMSRLDSLEKLLAEEKQLRMNLTANLNDRLNEEQRLRIQLTQELDLVKQQVDAQPSNSGYPAFWAVLSADVDQCTSDQHVIFDDVKYNEGGAYNSDHGVFTAPVAGTYMFTATLTASPHSVFNTAIVKSGDAIVGYFYAHDTDIYLERSTTSITHLDVNDDVWMKCRRNSQIRGEFYHSHMSGVLISPDA